MKVNKKIRMAATIILMFKVSTLYSQDTGKSEDEKSFELFYNAETKEARNILSGFSFEMLENFTNQYMSSDKMQNVQNIKESRKFWLIEEYYKRKADKTAADRFFYVFLAVTILLLLIFILTFRIYQMQKKLEDQE
ncbi:MAG: hypothetical protein OEV78_00570 [Spirochaetia bacterium]|nr:hypothetical protein [Spirochaetia bacterium]